MKLNDRSCLLDSFACILNLTPKYVAEEIGHQGPEGFHSQELIDFCLVRKWTVTTIERYPVAQNPQTLEIRPIEFPGGNEARFAWWLESGEGVLMGRTPFTLKPHAVAWTGLHAYDSGINRSYELLNERGLVSDLFFIPHTFLRMDSI